MRDQTPYQLRSKSPFLAEFDGISRDLADHGIRRLPPHRKSLPSTPTVEKFRQRRLENGDCLLSVVRLRHWVRSSVFLAGPLSVRRCRERSPPVPVEDRRNRRALQTQKFGDLI